MKEWEFCRSVSQISQRSSTRRKILRYGASCFTSHPMVGVLRTSIALKNTSPRPGLNPRPLLFNWVDVSTLWVYTCCVLVQDMVTEKLYHSGLCRHALYSQDPSSGPFPSPSIRCLNLNNNYRPNVVVAWSALLLRIRGGAGIKSWPGERVYWLWFLVVLLNPSRQIPG
jgi:hypothetical protein